MPHSFLFKGWEGLTFPFPAVFLRFESRGMKISTFPVPTGLFALPTPRPSSLPKSTGPFACVCADRHVMLDGARCVRPNAVYREEVSNDERGNICGRSSWKGGGSSPPKTSAAESFYRLRRPTRATPALRR